METATSPPSTIAPLPFAQAVEALKRTAEGERRTALDQGDIALAAVPWGAPDSAAQIERLAEAAGLDGATLSHRRRIAYRVPAPERAGLTWVAMEAIAAAEGDAAEHARLLALFRAPNPARADGRWTRAEVRRVQGQVVGYGPEVKLAPPESPVSPAQQAIALLADPETRASVLGNPASRAAVERAVEEARQADRDRVAGIRAADPVSRHLDAQQALLEVTKLMSSFAIDIAFLVPKLPDLPPAEGDPFARTWTLRDARNRLQTAVDRIDSYLASGSPGGDIDAFVRGLLAQPKEDRP
jgi:hypothetical protein